MFAQVGCEPHWGLRTALLRPAGFRRATSRRQERERAVQVLAEIGSSALSGMRRTPDSATTNFV
jgi:hypothetical protein